MVRIAIVLGAVIAALVVVGTLLVVYDDLAAPPIIIGDPVPGGIIVVEITGAVGTPGVYNVAADARVADVVVAAGGTRPDADLGAINLARRVHDEDELVIPSRQPTARPAQASMGPSPSATVESDSSPDRININTASVTELDTLPGIGPVLAQRIIDDRTENGPYRTIDDLARVSGISPAMVEELRPQITAGE